jgi:amidase
MMNDLIFTPAYQLARTIRQRHVSAVEVVEAYLAHIARHNPLLNAIVTLDEDGAHQRAEAADKALAQSQVWGPLHGVPITLEDAHATAHLRSTWGGLSSLVHHVPSEDGTVAARLKAAGAILVGKTHGPAIWGDDSVFGRTNNPWDLERTPGGSSAGPGAALAAGLTPLDIGLDTLGSIQNPAHYCGIFGMRPTEHRVPLTGAFFIDAIRKFHIMSVVGPMARSVEDLRLALQIIAGPDGYDSDVPLVPWREVGRPELRTLRIAWTPTFPEMRIAREIHTAIEELARELAQRGAQIEQWLPEVNFAEQTQLGEYLFTVIGGAFEPQPEGTLPTSLDDYLKALHQRDLLISTWEQFFTDWDILLCPAGPIVAERHANTEVVVDGSVVPQEQQKLLDIPYILSPITGCPTIVIPLGRNQSGLPFGVQVMGRRWEDERLLAIAEALSEITGGFQRPPGY